MVSEERVLVISDLDGASAVLWDQDFVTRFYTDSYSLSIFVKATWTDGQHLCFIELLDGGFGEEDATSSLCFGFYALDKDTVKEWCEGLD